MNRNTIIALSVAAVVGTTCGVALAVHRSPERTPAAASRTSPTPTSATTSRPTTGATTGTTTTPTVSGEEGSTNEPLLWANKQKLHDGETVVDLGLRGDVQRVVRMSGGWVVAERTSSQEAAYALWWLTPNGTPRHFGDVVGSWDADPMGQSVVGQNPDDNGQITAWTPATRTVRIWDRTQSGATYAGFVGDKVLIAMDDTDGGKDWQSFLWDPATARTTRANGATSIGYPRLQLSNDGAWLTGTSNQEGAPDANGTCLHLQSTNNTSTSWNTCDWRLNSPANYFSPDGSRLLVVPSETDGFGPGLFGVVDVADGPRSLVAQVKMPQWTMDAQLTDDDHLVVMRATDGDMTSFAIESCDFDGNCTVVATSKSMPAVGSSL